MIKCNNCLKETQYTYNGLCYECNQRSEEIKASLVYPVKTIAILTEILEELKGIKIEIAKDKANRKKGKKSH